MGDFPLMTDTGTFIINGARARHRHLSWFVLPASISTVCWTRPASPCIPLTIIPNRGAWLEYETDSNDVLWVRIDRARKLPITVILRALGWGTDDQIIELMGEDERLHGHHPEGRQRQDP